VFLRARGKELLQASRADLEDFLADLRVGGQVP
jgi:hypothetical protein